MTEPVTRPFLFPGEWQPPVLYRVVPAKRHPDFTWGMVPSVDIAPWLCPRRQVDRYAYVTWLHPDWWRALKWDLLGPTFRALIWLGLWDLREGDYYVNGWWCWGTSRAGDLERYWHPGWRGFWKSVTGEW